MRFILTKQHCHLDRAALLSFHCCLFLYSFSWMLWCLQFWNLPQNQDLSPELTPLAPHVNVTVLDIIYDSSCTLLPANVLGGRRPTEPARGADCARLPIPQQVQGCDCGGAEKGEWLPGGCLLLELELLEYC